ncbi:DUF928 domain-containing protein [Desertifilum sp. FACHB-1129]|uniref:DUF928 domain-containing protein n=2 Tax=Desertifilum tharense IPPAS B-1220 TaxID=1781255 RepID=A0A1E5QIG3_9CYAN|nr:MULTISPECIES: DUF928 domain-containing protein [Desertifilum]MDA0209138.1 DUF928 domain-containing protein [Cyanobacteria bacterium FC1]MBD2311792.1 DUF928 domain-containing protein [Desertifilum sp. FACHB-1129]MBD2325022.1 DUF928 domain-containing protein [Desertifilum sp. FACHB-866]MBD2333367.1 DUF928 domain-containing protein [Desertifilum sp. FACHB-868]OEJ74123.1 hypothetical protein BH720_16310 [Desertifilum tharense IPPAS B-1220]
MTKIRVLQKFMFWVAAMSAIASPFVLSQSSLATRVTFPSFNNQNDSGLEDPGRPTSQSSGGRRTMCGLVEPALTALIPKHARGLTLTESPTFWFYVPYAVEQAHRLEFQILDSKNKRLYRTSFTLPQNSNLVSLTLPATHPLKSEETYIWSFSVYCNPQIPNAFANVGGLIKRPNSSVSLQQQIEQAQTLQEKAIVYANHKIWYDALNSLAQLRCQEPENALIQADWQEALKSVEGLEAVAEKSELQCYSHQ